MLGSSLLPFVLSQVHVLLMLLVFMDAGVQYDFHVDGGGTANTSSALDFTSGFVLQLLLDL